MLPQLQLMIRANYAYLQTIIKKMQNSCYMQTHIIVLFNMWPSGIYYLVQMFSIEIGP